MQKTEERERLKEAIKAGIKCTDYLQRSKGGLYNCPFCGSGTHGGPRSDGAVKFYAESNTCYCNACARHFDAIELLQHNYGLDYNGALEKGRELLGGLSLPLSAKKETKAAQEAEPKKKADFRAYYAACEARLADPAPRAYLEGRGISLETARFYRLGFDPLADPANNPGGAGESLRPCPRLIVPTSTAQYWGRSIDATTPKAYAKMNAKGATPKITHKGILYNFECVFILEGIFDAMSIYEATGGKVGAVALNSTANWKKIVEALEQEKSPAQFITLFDYDENEKTRERVKAAERELNEKLHKMGYKSTAFDFRPFLQDGEKDVNDVMRRDPAKVAELVEEARKALELQEEKRETAADPAPLDPFGEFAAKIQGETYKPVTSGFSWFDDLMGGGFFPDTMTYILAAPATGKTTLCMQLAESMARQGRKVAYFNFESGRNMMYAKAISALLARKRYYVTTAEVLKGYEWSQEQRAKILEALEEYRETTNKNIIYCPEGTSATVESMAARLQLLGEDSQKSGTPAPVLFVDYIHLLRAEGAEDPRETLKRASGIISEYTKKYHTFAVIISATNRTSNEGGALSITSGRDSSNIEYDADAVITMQYYEVDAGTVRPTEGAKMEELKAERLRRLVLRAEKNRWGQGTTQNVYFNAENNIFYGANEYLPAELCKGLKTFRAEQKTQNQKRI